MSIADDFKKPARDILERYRRNAGSIKKVVRDKNGRIIVDGSDIYDDARKALDMSAEEAIEVLLDANPNIPIIDENDDEVII